MAVTLNIAIAPLAGEHNVRPAYRADIDGLRAFAILAVVLYHAFPSVLPGGFVGVDIFFVISGFLISTIIFNSFARDDFSLLEFYAHRVKRIFPALLLVLGVCFGFGWIELWPDEYSQLGKHMAGGMGFVVNFLLWGEAGYFDTASELKPLMHLWSLGIEEQFYLLYPVLIWLIWGGRARLALLVGLLALASFTANVVVAGSDPVGGFFLPQYRFWELLAGGLLALSVQGEGGRSGSLLGGLSTKLLDVLSLAGLAILIAAASMLHSGLEFPGWWATLPVVGTLLLIAAGPAARVNRGLLANPFMKFVGVISYPLYLWHWPILAFARIADSPELGVGIRSVAVGVSILLAWLTYHWIERPIRFGHRTWIKTTSLCILGVMVGFVGYKTFDREGFRFRQKDFGNTPELLGSQEWVKSTASCRALIGPPEPEYCLQMDGAAPRVALVGDSHAGSLYPGLSAALGDRGEGLLFLGAPGCPPLADTDFGRGAERGNKACMAMTNHVLETVTTHPTVQTIILAMRGPRNMYGTGFGAVEASMKPKEIRWKGGREGAGQLETFKGALDATVARILASGKRVVIVADWPELGFDPRVCLNVRPVQFSSRKPSECAVSRSAVEARNRDYKTLLGSLERRHADVKVFDPWPFLCDNIACHAIRDGELLYQDNNHLSVQGSMLVGPQLAAAID
jgi:peptidoglycan/LPS O-acetylase OafA/YrhL